MPFDDIDEEFSENFKKAFFALVEDRSDLTNTGFDLWAKPTSMFHWAQEYIPGLIVYSAGGFFPYQAEGLINGHPFYYRSEQGSAQVRIGVPNGEVPYLWDEAHWGASVDDFEGSAHDTFIQAMTMLLPKLERPGYYYEFECLDYEFTGTTNSWGWEIHPDGTPRYQGAHGNTAEEAFENVMKPSEYFTSNGFAPERQVEFKKALQMDVSRHKPVTARVYPEVEPVFHSTPFFAQNFRPKKD